MIERNETLNDDCSASFMALQNICNFKKYDVNASNFNVIDKLSNLSNDFVNFSTWNNAKGPSYDLESEYHKVITDDGVCYSSSMLSEQDFYTKAMSYKLRYPRHDIRSNWTIFGYESTEFSYPPRVMGAGKNSSVQIKLSMRRKDIDYVCKRGGTGFTLTLHTPDEMPQTSFHSYKIPFDHETLIAILPKVTTTSPELIRYLPKKRQCYFNGEKILKFFENYNQANCQLECLAGMCNFAR